MQEPTLSRSKEFSAFAIDDMSKWYTLRIRVCETVSRPDALECSNPTIPEPARGAQEILEALKMPDLYQVAPSELDPLLVMCHWTARRRVCSCMTRIGPRVPIPGQGHASVKPPPGRIEVEGGYDLSAVPGGERVARDEIEEDKGTEDPQSDLTEILSDIAEEALEALR